MMVSSDLDFRKYNQKEYHSAELEEKTIMDLILEYAESIKKNQMTSFHLLYGYSCICLMNTDDLCRKLNAKKEKFESISYCKYRIQKIFNDSQIEISPQILKNIISQRIDELEQDNTAVEVYHTVLRYMEGWGGIYSIETVTFSILNQILHNRESFIATL